MTESVARPPRPRLVLRVGITGKRAVPEEVSKDVRTALDNVFKALGEVLVACRDANSKFVSDDPPLLRIISGMAEGADQIAAEAAIAAHKLSADRKVETQLAAILPFLKEEYEKDFKRDPFQPSDAPDRPAEVIEKLVARFRELLCGAEAVLEIDDEALRDPANKKFHDRAYANLGDVLLEHADILVAISNDENRGAGGTVDVLGKALDLKIPVIKISLITRKVHLLHAAEPDAANPAPVEGQEMVGQSLPSGLVTLITRTLEPPQDTQSENLTGHGHGPRPVRERLTTFFGEGFSKGFFKMTFTPRFFDRVFKAFRNSFSARPDAKECFIVKVPSVVFAFVSALWSYRTDLKSQNEVAENMWKEGFDVFAKDKGKAARKVLAARYGWVDVLAIHYADATRSAHILLALLAASAVLMALMPLIMPDQPENEAILTKIQFLLVELLVLLVAWLFFQPARNGRWHERFVEYRAVAELLRHERFIYALGAADRPGRAADRTWSEPDAWIGWYVRATLRELGFPRAEISAETRTQVLSAFLKHELRGHDDGQIAYNRVLAERYKTIDRRLEKIILLGFWITVATAALGALLLGAFLTIIPPGPFRDWLHNHLHEIKPGLTIVAAFIPALIAALHGIRFQIDFRGTATRSESTTRELEKVAQQVEDALGQGTAPGRKQALSLVRDANQAMSADVAGWLNIYRGKGPEL